MKLSRQLTTNYNIIVEDDDFDHRTGNMTFFAENISPERDESDDDYDYAYELYVLDEIQAAVAEAIYSVIDRFDNVKLNIDDFDATVTLARSKVTGFDIRSYSCDLELSLIYDIDNHETKSYEEILDAIIELNKEFLKLDYTIIDQELNYSEARSLYVDVTSSVTKDIFELLEN